VKDEENAELSRGEMQGTFRHVSRAITRIGAADRARGRALFGDDIPLKEALVLRVLRSEKAHARLIEVDTEEAKRLPGVVGVLTASDVPGRNLFGLIRKDQPLLADRKVRFVGEAIALVVARNEESAQSALDAVRIQYEDLPSVFDPEIALQESAALVHERGNLLFRKTIRKGDVSRGLSLSHTVAKGTYRTPHLEHAYLEPDSGVGYVDCDGTFVIQASTQNPHYDQKEVSEILGIEEERVRVIQAATGGGFGSKLDLTVQGYIALALFHYGRPVRLVFTREETYLSTPKRHPFVMYMETGVDENGKLLALKAKLICDTGAYASYGIAVATRAAAHATGPYEIEHVEVESLAVYTNNPVAGAMRGFGVPQVAFAHESQMDLLANATGLDPFEIRRINALRSGSRTGTGQELRESVGLLKTLEAVEPYYSASKEKIEGMVSSGSKRTGLGIGAMWYGIGNTGVQNPSSARVQMDPEGEVTLFTGAAEIGQGCSTVLPQIVSEVLGIAPEEVHLVAADTKWTTNAGATSASRQTYISGNAVKEAAGKLAEVLFTEAVDVLGAPKAFLSIGNGFVCDSRRPRRRVSLKDLARRAHSRGRPLSWQGYFDPETTPLDEVTGQGIPYATYAFACHLATVEVDTWTGEVRAVKIVAAHDVGKAIHPQNVKGQIEGGVVMGIGFALMEEYLPGTTISMGDYKIPTAMDIPKIIPIVVEEPEPTGPFGAKGVGEPALIPTAPAILNAITDAVGVRIYALPANLERVRNASECHIHSRTKEG
jgi:CO/xanthine dehydrogenase Mo-binding subunit